MAACLILIFLILQPPVIGVSINPVGYKSPMQVQMYSLHFKQSYYVYNTSFGYLASLYLTKGSNNTVILQYYTKQDGFQTVTLELKGWETLSFATVYLLEINTDYCNIEFHCIQLLLILPFIILLLIDL